MFGPAILFLEFLPLQHPFGQTSKVSDEEKEEDIISYLRSIGATKFADFIAEERLVRRVLEARIEYDYYSWQAEIWKDREEKALEFAVSAQAMLFDKSANYNNVIVTLGYAGFFSVWSLVSDELTRNENAFVGLFLGVSLLLFVFWTLRVSVLLALNVRRYAVIAGTTFQTFDEELNAHKLAEERTTRAMLRAQRHWPFFFILTTLSGLVAGITVLAELFFQIVGIELDLVENLIAKMLVLTP